MQVARIPLSETRRMGGREVDAGAVARLKDSMAAVGLLSPIMVTAKERQDGPTRITTYWIVAGRHRAQAARDLGWAEIDAVIVDHDAPRAELCEIDENLCRSDLTDSQRAVAHARREELMVELGLVKPGAGRPNSAESAKLPAYAMKAAADLGQSDRTVRSDLRRGKNIAADVMAEVSGTDLDKGVVLDELASAPRDEQRAKLAEITARRSQVRPAADPLNDPEAHEKQLAALMSAWNRAAAVVREEFMLRIDTPVFDKSRVA